MTRDTLQIMQYEDSMPAMAREIAGLIGMPDTLRLVEALGGTTFPVPKRGNKLGELRFCMLEQAVGVKAAEILCQQYGGTNLYIPRCADVLRKIRNAELIGFFDAYAGEGKSGKNVVAELALKYKLSDRRVWEILKTSGAEAARGRKVCSITLFEFI
uniref:Mor transcription activator domain protein n=1 Tax=Nitratidesulfovibrio vulgaris (strain DSM 19637 / Miyazaki F) TaxID=883 RepID=B8DKX5_NITV9